jgi:putative ABC transport system substrate-binding protein
MRIGYPIARLSAGVALLLLTALFSFEARSAGKVFRIGALETRSEVLNAANIYAFRQGLKELGYEEGQNIEIEYRSSEGRDERFRPLARELVRSNVDLILTRGTPAALAAKGATRTIPIVMAASADPVGTGIVTSLAHPDANVTGLSSALTETYAKRVELLKDLLPGLARIAAIFNMGNPVIPPQWRTVAATARSLGIEAQLLDVRRPEDLPAAFDAAVKQRAEALVVGLDGVTQANLRPIAEFALARRLPSIYAEKAYANLGGLITYGASDSYMYHRAAAFADKIFRGSDPRDLPIEQPTEFELVINLKTAKALALTIPQTMLVRANEVIQ